VNREKECLQHKNVAVQNQKSLTEHKDVRSIHPSVSDVCHVSVWFTEVNTSNPIDLLSEYSKHCVLDM